MNGRTRHTTISRNSRAFRRYGLTLIVPTVLALSALPAAPAWAATVATHQNVPRHVSVVSSRAVQGLYRCTSSPTCDIVNANMQFTNYSSVCLYQDCNFVSAADWEDVVLGLEPSVATLKGEYANARQIFGGGLNMSQLWSYWRNRGIDGAVATKITPYARSKTNTELTISNFGAAIAELVTKKNSRLGTSRCGAGVAIILVDGFDPKGPLVVYQAKTLQMTWSQWSAYSRGMWGVTASTNGSTTITTTPVGSSTSIVIFDANGGSGVMANETETVGTSAALTLNTFTRTGYAFSGWNTNANGSGTSYANGATFSFSSSITLYAQWTVSTPTMATITFNANGGSGFMPSETEAIGTSASLTTNAFTRTGYNFYGWNTAANGSGTNFTNDELVKFTGSVTLFAQWTLVPTSVSFSGTTSSNWSGYVLPTSTIMTIASGQWTVPTLNCADTPNSNSSTWVGTGGETWTSGGWSGSLLQTGIEDDCVNGVQQDSGWWEIVPASPNNEQTFTNFSVGPGDSIFAEVYQTASGQWVTVVQDLTTGLQGVMETGNSWDVTTIANNTLVGGVQGDASGMSYSGGYTAEWIQEDTMNMTAGSLFPLANYGTVTFTNLETNLSSWSLPNSDAWEITNSSNVPVSVPSTVSNDGFTVTYTGP